MAAQITAAFEEIKKIINMIVEALTTFIDGFKKIPNDMDDYVAPTEA